VKNLLSNIDSLSGSGLNEGLVILAFVVLAFVASVAFSYLTNESKI